MNPTGHYWTLGGYLQRRLSAAAAPPSSLSELVVEDERFGPIRLTGQLSEPAGADSLLLVIHGVGGCSDSLYAVAAAGEAYRCGSAALRVNLRGADRLGEDIYHGGLTSDLGAFVALPALQRYRRIVVVGFSLGGHLALRWATGELDPRVRAIAAVCPPLDLLHCATAIDRPSQWIYRRHILQQLKEIYAQVAARRELPTAVEEVRRVRSMIRFDDLTVARRHGFADARDYYEKMSVGPRLRELRVPALIVEALADPMVPAAGVRPYLEAPPSSVTVRRLRRGGHIGFPADLDIGVSAPPGIDSQVLGWLLDRSAGERPGDPPSTDAVCSPGAAHA